MLWWLWHARGGFEVAMRDGDYKLLATMVPQVAPGGISDAKPPGNTTIMEFIRNAELDRFELFDLKTDPSEAKNIASIEPTRFEQLRKRMIDLHAEIRTEGPEYQLGRTSAKTTQNK